MQDDTAATVEAALLGIKLGHGSAASGVGTSEVRKPLLENLAGSLKSLGKVYDGYA